MSALSSVCSLRCYRLSLDLLNCLDSSLFFSFKQKTAYEMRISDWSSDVCSSDLPLCQRPSPPLMASSNLGPAAPSQKLRNSPLALIRLTWPATDVWITALLPPPGSVPSDRPLSISVPP